MSFRRPAVTFTKPGEALDRIRDREDQLEKNQLLNGRLLELTFPFASAVARLNHGLGRSYVGALVVGVQTNFAAGDFTEVRVMTPERAAEAGYDPNLEVVIARDFGGGSVGEIVFNAWVF